MEGEVIYSTVIFNRLDEPAAVELPEEEVYAEVKENGEALSQSKPEPTSKNSAVVVEEVAHNASYRQATVCLGLLCVLLLAGLVAMSVINVIQVSQHSALLALYTNESTTLQRTQAEKASLEIQKQGLTVQRGHLNATLWYILNQFTSFPVKAYCQITQDVIHCEPCMKNWVKNGSSCYFFYSEDKNWRSWYESRTYCTEMGGDLVIIDSREEQEFIRQHTPFYYDQHHGYWIGLQKKNQIWTWSTGATLDKEFWIDSYQKYQTYACVLSNPSSVSVNSWKTSSCGMFNKWICEIRAIEWPNKI